MRRPPTDRSRSSVDAQGGRRGIRWSRRSGLGRAVFAVLVVILLTASSFAAVVLLPGARPPATSSSHSTSSAAVSSTTGSEVTSTSSSTVLKVQYQPVFRASVGWIDTDAEGRYNITLPYSGPTKGVDVDATGYLRAISYVSVEPGQKVPFDWYLTRSSIVSGRVLLPDGTPVAGVEVSLRTSSGETVEMGGRTPTWTSSDGRFVFDTNVAPGTYHLFVWALGTRYLAPWWDVVEEHPDYLPGTLCTSGSDFTVADHSLKDVTIQVPYSAAVVGRVTDAYGHPAANVHVMAIKTSSSGPTLCFMGGAGGEVVQYTDTNSSGYFEIANGLATGQYNITIVDAGGSYYGRTSLGHGAATGSRIVNVTAGQISRADFVLPTSATLTGRVTYGNGTAASSATVEAWGPGGTGFHAKNGTDSNGYYELDAGLGTGDYSIWVFGFTEGGWLEFPRNPPFHMVAGQSYALNFTGTFHAYLTTYTANLTGTVTDSEGGPVPYAYLEAGGANHSVWGWGSGDANGAYSMVLTSFSRTAIYNVTASAPGYQTTWALLNFTDGANAKWDPVLADAVLPPPSPEVSFSGTVRGEVYPSLVGPERIQVWMVNGSSTVYRLFVTSDSMQVGARLNRTLDQMTFWVDGPSGTPGDFTIAIPKTVMVGPFAAQIDGQPVQLQVLEDNATDTVLKLTYTQASHAIVIGGTLTLPGASGSAVLQGRVAAVVLMVAPLSAAAGWRRLPTLDTWKD